LSEVTFVGSSSYWPVYKNFASQSLHNRNFFKKKSGDVNDEANFSLFILLHKRAKPAPPPYPRPHLCARTQTFTPPLHPSLKARGFLDKKIIYTIIIYIMSISSTGLYGSATIVNSDLFTDVETLKETVTTLNTTYLQTTAEHRADISLNKFDISSNLSKINDISTNKIPNLILDISSNLSKINDISTNKIPNLILDVSKNTLDINDISTNKIPDLILDISENRFDISQNKADIS